MNARSIAVTATRILLGLIFFVFGLNGFLHFIPQPPMAGNAAVLMGGFAAAGYMFPLIKGTEVLGGALLLSNRFVPLGLALLAPVIVNIVLFHAFLAPPNPITFIILLGELFLAWSYRSAFAPMLRAKVSPAVAGEGDPAASKSAAVAQ